MLRMHWSADGLLPLSEIDEEEPTALAGVVGWLGAVGAGMVPSGWCIEEKASIACCPHGSSLFLRSGMFYSL